MGVDAKIKFDKQKICHTKSELFPEPVFRTKQHNPADPAIFSIVAPMQPQCLFERALSAEVCCGDNLDRGKEANNFQYRRYNHNNLSDEN